MDGRLLKQKIITGDVVYGTMISMSRSPRWATPFEGFGLDFVIIDSEHSPIGRGEMADLLGSFASSNLVPIVRVPIPDSHYVTMALDAGAQGVLVPYVETTEEVKDVLAAARWRPLKGILARKAVESGELPSQATQSYLESKNKNNVVIVGIESVPAIDALPDILDVGGVDAVFVGPNDLSISLGVPDQYDHPDYEAALRKVISLCRENNTPVMIHHQTISLTLKWLEEGARFVLYSSDARSLHNAYREEFGPIKALGDRLTGSITEKVGESEEII